MSEVVERLDRIEQRLRALRGELDGLQGELEAVRRLATARRVREPFPAPAKPRPAASPRPLATVAAEPPSAAEPPAEATEAEAPLAAAWRALERGAGHEAIRLANPVLDDALTSGDANALQSAAEFAAALRERCGGARGDWAVTMLKQIDLRRPPRSARVSPSPPRSGPSSGRRAVEALSGPRGFALAGGIVTLLGVVFLFVLAADRGWIGPVARVVLGGGASLLVLSAGVALRVLYGRLQASLAAVGTGVAGGFATLAAATIIYGFLPSWGALVVAAAIAAVGGTLALRWSSELLAGLSLVGASASPGLVALEDGIGAPGTAFALVVLAVTLFVAARRRWLWLAAAVGAVSLAQVIWLVAVAPAKGVGALAVATAAAAVLLGASVVWQSQRGISTVEAVAQTLTLAGGALALWSLSLLLPATQERGVALALSATVYASAAGLLVRRWRGLGWTTAGVALVLAGIATADLLSQQSLTIAWAIEAAALAVPAWRIASPRLELFSLVYLALGIVHVLTVDIWVNAPGQDLARSSAIGLYALAAAAVIVGTLACDGRARLEKDAPLAELWTAVAAGRGTIRFFLWGAAVALVAAGTTAALSGRSVTLALAGTGIMLALLAYRLGERRLQAAGVTFGLLATMHALVVDATPATLLLAHGASALAPVPSLAVVAAAWLAVGLCANLKAGGITFLGPLEGNEQLLDALSASAAAVRNSALAISAWFAVWAAGLCFVAASYDPGQAAASTLWAGTAIAVAALATRRSSRLLVLAAAAVSAAFGYGKAAFFDWHELSDPWPALALLAVSLGVLIVGFLIRYALPAGAEDVTGISLASAVLAAVSALIAIDRLVPDRTRMLGAAALVPAAVVATLALPPYRAWRRGEPTAWLRGLADGYGLIGLVIVGFSELCLFDGGLRATAAIWAVSGAAIATAARPLAEERLWLAAACWTALATILCVTVSTTPSRLFVATAHPGTGLWALATCVAALLWAARITPSRFRDARPWVTGSAEALTVFGISLAVLELAERISGASIKTDFQRGHTAVSAIWAVLALALFVAGLRTTRAMLRRIGLALFALSLAKLFLYDLSSLSSITRALSFLAVGAILLAAAAFVERNVHGGGRPGPPLAA